jgi:hypothetical protein
MFKCKTFYTYTPCKTKESKNEIKKLLKHANFDKFDHFKGHKACHHFPPFGNSRARLPSSVFCAQK